MKCLNKSCVRQANPHSNYCDKHKVSPGTTSKLVIGNSLAEIRDALAHIEAGELAVLVDLTNQSGENLASFRSVPPGEPVRQLILIEVEPESVHSLIAEQTARGRTFMFRSTVLVDDKEMHVAVFR